MTGHWESGATLKRRRRVVAGTAIAGASLLGASLSTKPDSRKFYALTLGVASVWTVGGLSSGTLSLGRAGSRRSDTSPPVATPIALGIGAFGAFYGLALVAKRIPTLDDALTSVMAYAREGSGSLVMLTTLANGLAEEIFFRGALYTAVGPHQPVARSTAAYVAATCATGNPALVLAAGAMGALFGLQRRASGGIQASSLTHLTWSALMVRYMPRLFSQRHEAALADGSAATYIKR
jgi:membrane protease YdiL (CAAX protease family)